MEILLDSKLEDLNDENLCRQQRGKDMAKIIFRRLSQIRAANTLDALRHTPGRWEELHGDRKGQFSVRLTGLWRLIFIPVGKQEEFLQSNAYLWNKIMKIKCIEIVNYHKEK